MNQVEEIVEPKRTTAMNKMYRSDMALVAVFFVAMWITLIFVLLQVHEISPTAAARSIATTAALLVGVFASGALVAVAVHLRKRRSAIYREDCENAGL